MHHHGSQLSRGPAGTRLKAAQKKCPSAGDWLVPCRDAGQNDVLAVAVARCYALKVNREAGGGTTSLPPNLIDFCTAKYSVSAGASNTHSKLSTFLSPLEHSSH